MIPPADKQLGPGVQFECRRRRSKVSFSSAFWARRMPTPSSAVTPAKRTPTARREPGALPSEGYRSRLSDHVNRRDQDFFTIQDAVLTALRMPERALAGSRGALANVPLAAQREAVRLTLEASVLSDADSARARAWLARNTRAYDAHHPQGRLLVTTSVPKISVAALAVLVCLLAIPAGASAQGSQAMRCPSSFQVEHDDRIGKLKLPEGAYRVTVLDPNLLSCASASRLFSQFLQDYDGKLPRPWALNVKTATFTRGSARTTGFRVQLITAGGGGGGGGNACPYFTVLHNDHIGKLALRAGKYRITLLSPSRLGCAAAAKAFAQFLQDFDGRLPRPWKLNVAKATFTRGNASTGFRVKPAVGPPPKPSGGGRHPASGTRICPGTFQVENDDRIGRLRLPGGPYLVTVLKGSGLSCQAASSRFTSFLNDFNGVLPRPWTVAPSTGTFTNGRKPGFRVKPTR